MVEEFIYDVFLSHSSKDSPVVREIAERLRADGIKVWFNEWFLKLGDNIREKTEEGLENSRALMLFVSANAVGPGWAELESQTLRFRDPLNQRRRFVVLRLDDVSVRNPLTQVLYIDWQLGHHEEYIKLLETLKTFRPLRVGPADLVPGQLAGKYILFAYETTGVSCYAFSADGRQVLIGGWHKGLRLWDVERQQCLRVFRDDTSGVTHVAWSANQPHALTADGGGRICLWNIETGRLLRVFKRHPAGGYVSRSVAWDSDQKRFISADYRAVRLWDAKNEHCIRIFAGHTDDVYSVSWHYDQRRIASCSADRTVRVWDIDDGHCLNVFEGHADLVNSVTWCPKGNQALSASSDKTLRLWDIDANRCLHVLEGHTDAILSLAVSADARFALSGSSDTTVRLWDLQNGRCLRVMEGHEGSVLTVQWSADGHQAFSGDNRGGICIWNLPEDLSSKQMRRRNVREIVLPDQQVPDQVLYTNAKVLLVGESGTGKTGLSKVLAGESWQPSDSTVGAWATQWKLSVPSDNSVEREIWLWDFGGQADQRLIHQLYMDESALAVLVFDGQKDDLFETLGQWDRDLTRASRKEFAKLLVAGRVDAGGLRVSRGEVEKFAADRKFRGFLETSAKKNFGCDELKKAILTSIDWNKIPCRTTEVLFKQLKEEIVRLKDEGRVLMRLNELRETLQLRLSSHYKRFSDDELRAVLTLLAGPGVVWELKFGSWVLLQPERVNAYAQAVIRTLQSDDHQRGCLMEERVLKGDLAYQSSMPRLNADEERFVLLAMHQTLVERGLCLRQPTAKGNLLVFPSYYRRERPEQVTFPAVLVNYRFTGFLDEIYATLVVRLHHSEAFEQDQLWRYAADFKTNTGKQLGIKLNRRAPGIGELEVYFDPSVAMEEKIIFSKYVHEHLLQHARDVERLRHYVCQKCGTPVGNRELAMKRLNDWLRGQTSQPDGPKLFNFRKRKDELPSIICADCERRVPLWDEMEQCFARAEIQQRVREMQEEATIVLSNQSKERALVGEVISTVALANQISREFNVSDNGIDMEIEFTDDNYEATGAKLYLQLKSGDSYLHKRKKDGTEVFTIKDERHARYWMTQIAPVLLVIRNSEGEVRWMEVRDWLRHESDNGKKPVKQIVFQGERFDVMSVRRWRDRVLGE